MPNPFTQTVLADEFSQIDPFIEARFPGVTRVVQPSADGKYVVLIDIPSITSVQFDTLITDLTAAFPNTMQANNQFDLPIAVTPATVAIPWAAMPAALTEFLGLTIHRTGANLAAKTQAQLIANVQVAGFAGSGLRVQCSLDNGATWRALDSAAGTGPTVPIGTVGVIKSPVVAIEALVRKDVLLRVVGGGGNAIVSPTFGTIVLRVR
jgi:hypothetical protein